MAGNVLDLIDHVVAEHELLSADAMRWAPDAPDAAPPPGGASQVRCDDDPHTPAQILQRALTDWQYELVGRIFKVPVQMLLSRPEVERRVRLRRMHSDYHRRTRRRNRGR